MKDVWMTLLCKNGYAFAHRVMLQRSKEGFAVVEYTQEPQGLF